MSTYDLIAGAIAILVLPATGWHPDDYYRASRRARAAWQARDQQLAWGFELGEGARLLVAEEAGTPVEVDGLMGVQTLGTGRLRPTKTDGELEDGDAWGNVVAILEPAPTTASPVARGLKASATEPRPEHLLRLAPPDGTGPDCSGPHPSSAGASVALLSHLLLLGGIREW